ncbi:MAG: RNA-binding transcriptional accessory protein [Clostridiales bacterium]|nr:RNA-binding transcriptional accessory protein [Clostridiales bacterium]
MIDIAKAISDEFKLTETQVNSTIALIDEGNTIPFIARYRKEATGGIDDVTLRNFHDRLIYLRNLEARKEEVIRLIDEQGKLTLELKKDIEEAEVLQRVEDLYKPFKKKRATRATKARDAGLLPLAEIIMAQEENDADAILMAEGYINVEAGYDTAEKTLQGALDIIAEIVADDAEIISKLRDFVRKNGLIQSIAVDSEEKTVYETYYDFAEAIKSIPNHRVLAINRGEKEGKLKVKVDVDSEKALSILSRFVVKGESAFYELIKLTLADSYKRLIFPALEREMRNELTQRAEDDAIKVFAKNTENLLQQRPVKDARIIAIDPGFRTGCKVAVLDEQGKLLDYTTIYPTKPRADIAGTHRTLKALAEKYNINIIVIGNGTASRETEEVVSDFIEKSGLSIKYTIVNEAGASVYSASKAASEEYPDLDVTTRGAMSLGRRLQDPLAELVKIPVKSIGVGQYQHDLNQGALESALTDVVENVVNRVGVDLNTASSSLLGYVAGIGSAVARNIVAYREENGVFTDRKQLKKVSKLGEKAYKQCAGFLRISNGKNPLDSTSVHPESYNVATELLNRAGVSLQELKNGGIPDIKQRIGDLSAISKELDAGLFTLKDIVDEMTKPGRDPRDDAPPVIFSRAVKSFEDLKPGMKLVGTVRNVVDFGAFVDIGVKQDGLVHISKLSDRFVRHPSEVVSVGDNVDVWVIDVDAQRGKISLSMVGE